MTLPNDVAALVHAARIAGRGADLIAAALRANDRVRGRAHAAWLDGE
jgi:hypothetical protein